MAANNSIDLVSLDFQTIKNSLRNYLRDNDQFKDYDYEGSNMNMLIEVLSINAGRTAFYQNMVLNESFLDSAVLRNSALSRSKELNYLPNSAKSSRARIRVVFTADGTSAPYVIPKGALITSLVKNDSFTFTFAETITVASASTLYEFEADVYEGFYVTDTYTFLPGVDNSNQRFEMTNKNVDLDSLTVTVYEDGNQIGDIYTYSTTLLDLGASSKVFFLQPSEHGFFEIIFGNSIHGRKPKGNSTIILNYRISSGLEANGAKIFNLDFDPTAAGELIGTSTVNTLSESRDGADAETLESIKFMAPRHFQVQERAVNSTDYSVMLRKQFPEINAVFTYGGEQLTPKRYGFVFSAIDIKGVAGLPDSKKAQYTAFLKNRTTFGLQPIFVAADFVFLQINTTVRYNLNVTAESAETIKSFIKDAIVEYRDTNLDNFNVILRRSKLETDIDKSDPSIISSTSDILSYKKIIPNLGKLENHTLEFGAAFRNDIAPNSNEHPARFISTLITSVFTYNSVTSTIEDDGDGILRVMQIDSGIHKKILNIGTIDYTNGIISIKDLKVDSFLGNSIKFFVRMKDVDVSASLNNILTIEDDEINIVLEEIRE